MSKRALIVVDIQNDYFPSGKWPLVGADAAADSAAQVIEAFRKAGDLLVHIRHESTEADAPFFVAGSEGAELHPKVRNRADEPVIVKHHINSFRDTELKALLDQHGIEQLLVVGSMSHICTHAIARAAADFGYDTTVIHDACATHDVEFNGVKVPAAQVHAAFMAALAFGYGAVISTEAFLTAA